MTDIGAAGNEEREAIEGLLARVDLPLEGVAEHFGGFLAAREGGAVIGSIGLERYGEWGLLRSLAVEPGRQGEGIGLALTERLLREAREGGVREVVLLTTTARDFFVRRFGFEVVERARFDAIFAASPEWHLPRCSSAVCLHLRLD